MVSAAEQRSESQSQTISPSQPASTTSQPQSQQSYNLALGSPIFASTSPSSITQQQSRAPPAVTITPASIDNTPVSTTSETLEPPPHPSTSRQPLPSTSPNANMMEKDLALTDSKTALLNSRSSTAASKEASTSTGSGTDGTSNNNANGRTTTPTTASTSPSAAAATKVPQEKSSASDAAPSSQTTSSPQTASASSKPSTTTKPIQRASQKKKRKRKGIAGLLLSLGCLSVDEFEDDPKATKPSTAGPSATPSTSANKQATPTAPTPAAGSSKTTAAAGPTSGHAADATGTTSSTLVQSETPQAAAQSDDVGTQDEEIVLAPTEPHILPEEETAGVTSSAVQPPGGGSSSFLGTPSRPHPQRRESEAAAETTVDVAPTEITGAYTESELVDENAQNEEGVEEYMDEDYEDEEDRLIEQGGMGIPLDDLGQPAPLLPPLAKAHIGRKCLVLDLDETLLHSSFKSLPTADYIVPVEIESQIHNVYVIKRPGVDNFLREMGKIYEIVVFTASLSKYADPVLDMLDTHGVVTHRLFRESCYNHKGNYVKDLSQLGRDIETSIIIDNSPASYIFHPNNAVPVSTWFNDPHDTELTDLCPFLADLATVDDVRGVLDGRLVYSR